MSNRITKGVRVTVNPQYVEEESEPEADKYFFSYNVTIQNEGDKTVQLVSRHWKITNAEGKVEEVKGPGVIGKQPVLKPGDTFNYSSFCPLTSPVGTMHGTYQMVDEDLDTFDAIIDPFTLAVPGILQ